MKIKIVCPRHNRVVEGQPALIPTVGPGQFVVDPGDMMCPGYREENMFGCWNDWKIVLEVEL